MPDVAESKEPLELSTLLVTCWTVTYEVKHLLYDLAILPLGLYPMGRRTDIHKQTYTRTFRAVIFIIVPD